jgi:transcriptional regulator GlxA family with amidase domain
MRVPEVVAQRQLHRRAMQTFIAAASPRRYGAMSQKTSVNVRSTRLRAVVGLVESGSSYTSRELAARVRLTPPALRRLFKHETGVCFGEWLTEQRLQRAAHLLAHSFLSIKEITHAVDYEHPSSFIRAFERRFLLTPSSYRSRRARSLR